MKTRAEKERDRYKDDPEYRAQRQKRNKDWRINNRNSDAVIARRKFYTLKQNAKTRKIEINITPRYLREILVAQDRKCAVTGRQLDYQGPACSINAPSVDRIDRTKGYVEGNLRWVTYQVNVALSVGSLEELRSMCRDVLKAK